MTEGERRKAIVNDVLRTMAQERERQGLSRNGLATKAGLNQSVISRLESGISQNPTVDSLLRIADALDVDLGSLLTKASNVRRTKGLQKPMI